VQFAADVHRVGATGFHGIYLHSRPAAHQSAPPGSAFTRGQVIIVKISPGPPQVHIPNVDGMPVDQATRLLESLGFSVNVNQIGPMQTVFNYSPNGQAPKGSTITLWVGL